MADKGGEQSGSKFDQGAAGTNRKGVKSGKDPAKQEQKQKAAKEKQKSNPDKVPTDNQKTGPQSTTTTDYSGPLLTSANGKLSITAGFTYTKEKVWNETDSMHSQSGD